MDKSEKLAIIQRYESAVDPLIDFIKSIPVAAIDFRPNLEGAWTIRDHAIHFLDADTFGYGRARLAVTQPGVEVFIWNEDVWQQRGKYEVADAMATLETCRALRRVVGAMSRSLIDGDWESFYIRHAQRGRLTLADVLRHYTEHAQFHLSYFRRNLEAFTAAR